MSSNIQSRSYGKLPDGRTVESWTLTGSAGLVLEVITLGGIVTRLLAPDRKGRFDDVVLGFNRLEDYLAGHPYFGSITGRVAGRTTKARFKLGGVVYQLAANDAPNHLHGGLSGFDKKLWSATALNRADNAPSLQLQYHSRDGEEGYPGNVQVTVAYTITEDNSFQIDTEAVSDMAPPLCLTHHSYFNLAGNRGGTIKNHVLQINAETFVPTDEAMTLQGKLENVQEGKNDFRSARNLGEALPHLYRQHGDLYSLTKSAPYSENAVSAASLFDPGSGRVMNIDTNEPFLQLYTGSSLDGTIIGKQGHAYQAHAGVCLECQGYPDACNQPAMDDILLQPGKIHRRRTTYHFSV